MEAYPTDWDGLSTDYGPGMWQCTTWTINADKYDAAGLACTAHLYSNYCPVVGGTDGFMYSTASSAAADHSSRQTNGRTS